MSEYHDRLHDGSRVLLRPLRVADAALYPDFLASLTPRDLRLRFFAPMREVPAPLIEKLIHYDPQYAIALISIEEASGRMLGVVRVHDDATGAGGEFAIIVRSNLKGHGLGWFMMHHMIEAARAKGLKTMHGQVLAENTTMLKMCAELGFQIDDEPGDPGIKKVTLSLQQAPARS